MKKSHKTTYSLRFLLHGLGQKGKTIETGSTQWVRVHEFWNGDWRLKVPAELMFGGRSVLKMELCDGCTTYKIPKNYLTILQWINHMISNYTSVTLYMHAYIMNTRISLLTLLLPHYLKVNQRNSLSAPSILNTPYSFYTYSSVSSTMEES